MEKNGYQSVWAKYHSDTQDDDNNGEFMKIRINCSTMSYAMTQLKKYDAQGNLLENKVLSDDEIFYTSQHNTIAEGICSLYPTRNTATKKSL